MITTTLVDIRPHIPEGSFNHLLKKLGVAHNNTSTLSLESILDICGLECAIQALDALKEYAALIDVYADLCRRCQLKLPSISDQLYQKIVSNCTVKIHLAEDPPCSEAVKAVLGTVRQVQFSYLGQTSKTNRFEAYMSKLEDEFRSLCRLEDKYGDAYSRAYTLQ